MCRVVQNKRLAHPSETVDYTHEEPCSELGGKFPCHLRSLDLISTQLVYILHNTTDE
jgi:hypothetical protein